MQIKGIILSATTIAIVSAAPMAGQPADPLAGFRKTGTVDYDYCVEKDIEPTAGNTAWGSDSLDFIICYSCLFLAYDKHPSRGSDGPYHSMTVVPEGDVPWYREFFKTCDPLDILELSPESSAYWVSLSGHGSGGHGDGHGGGDGEIEVEVGEIEVEVDGGGGEVEVEVGEIEVEVDGDGGEVEVEVGGIEVEVDGSGAGSGAGSGGGGGGGGGNEVETR